MMEKAADMYVRAIYETTYSVFAWGEKYNGLTRVATKDGRKNRNQLQELLLP